MANTKIEWATRVWNPVRGCTRVSPGCEHCYAERFAARGLPGHLSSAGQRFAHSTPAGPHWTGEVELIESKLEEPLHWKKSQRIFVNSMADLFHERLRAVDIEQVFQVMNEAHWHTFIVLTKRAESMRLFCDWWKPRYGVLNNLWLGVSCEDQERADERIPLLLQTPAALRFISCEPLLGEIDLRYLQPGREVEINALGGTHGLLRPHGGKNAKLDWVICGGESGPGARPMHPDWVRSIKNQCEQYGIPFFFKQWGEYAGYHIGSGQCYGSPAPAYEFPDGMRVFKVGQKSAGYLLDGKEYRQVPELE